MANFECLLHLMFKEASNKLCVIPYFQAQKHYIDGMPFKIYGEKFIFNINIFKQFGIHNLVASYISKI